MLSRSNFGIVPSRALLARTMSPLARRAVADPSRDDAAVDELNAGTSGTASAWVLVLRQTPCRERAASAWKWAPRPR